MADDLWQRIVANDFADFEGARITGSLPVRDALLNALLAEILEKRDVQEEAPPAAPTEEPGIGARLWKLVRRLEVRSGNGVVTLEIEMTRGQGRKKAPRSDDGGGDVCRAAFPGRSITAGRRYSPS